MMDSSDLSVGEYEPPEVLELGPVEELTLGNVGIFIDYSGETQAKPPIPPPD